MASLVTILLIPHLLAVNLASVAPLVCVVLEWAAARGNVAARRLARSLAWHGFWALIAGSLIGTLIGFLLWNDEYRGALKLLGTRLHYGGAELVFSLVLMLIHAWWWSRAPEASAKGRWARGFLALLAGTNLIYHFPVLMVVLARIATGADPLTSPLDSPAFRQRLVDPEVIARCTHVWLASFAVTGTWMLGLSWCWQRRSAADTEAVAAAQWGARMAVVATLLQIPSGIWLLSTLSGYLQSQLLGGHLGVTAAFGTSVLLSLWLMHQLSAIGMGETRPSALARAMLLLVAIVGLMTFVLRHLEILTQELSV